ncbi:LCP family protein [Prauserella alba]|uniref:LCP family protein n=1 Tax=Prauserella alba TaxID=176898 RepID=UPI0020A4FF6B|nr:LCP family protein [Prauserella alba]MCP2183690.1 transcriptional attenuator, LytR family [Prauserella alba]
MNEREEQDAERQGSEDSDTGADTGTGEAETGEAGTEATPADGDQADGDGESGDGDQADGDSADRADADSGDGADATPDTGDGEEPAGTAGRPSGTPRPTPHRRTRAGSHAAATQAATPAPSPTGANRGGRLRRTGRATGRTVVTLLSVIALCVTGYAYARLDQLHDAIETTDALDDWHYESSGDDEAPPPPPKDDGATDILLVGADSRTDMQGNPLPLSVLKALRTESTSGIKTDTMIILRIPKDGSDPVGVSVPRDTWVDVPHGGKDKVNSAYGAAKNAEWQRLQADGVTDRAQLERDSNQAGRRALVRTLQDFTQVHIDHYAEINLLGFYLLTEAIGGVEVCLNAPTKDKDSGADFDAGVQTVSGGEALSYVRQRKNLPNGDLDRIVRQHTFLSSALDKAMSTGTLTNPDKLSDLIDTVRRSLVLDPDLDVLGFAQQAKDLLGDGMEFETIPVTDVAARSSDGQSIVTVDLQRVRSFIRGLAHGSGGQDGAPSNDGGGASPGPTNPSGAAGDPPSGGGAAVGGSAAGGAARGVTGGVALSRASGQVPCVN